MDKKIEKYITENNLDGTKSADVLRDYAKGRKPLGDISHFYGYDNDMAIYHVKKINGEW